METTELREYGRALKKRWWIMAGLVLIVCSCTALYSFNNVTPMYQATTKLIVNRSDAVTEMVQIINVSEINANIMLINTYKEIIRTSAIMDQVVAGHPELQMTSEQLMNRVIVGSVNDSQVMTLTVRDTSYERAMNIVNAVAEVFRESIPTIMKVDNVTILDAAKPRQHPAPVNVVNPVFNIAVSLFVALMLGIGLCFLLEYMDDTVKNEKDVADVLGLPTYAVIRKMTNKDLYAHTKRMNMKEAPYATINQ